MKGRKPLPTKIKALKGTLQKCRARKDEPQPELELLEPPDELCEVGKKAWRETAKNLFDNGLLTALDQRMLMLLCDSYAMYRNAKTIVLEEGMVIEALNSAGEPIQRIHPACKVMPSAMDRTTSLMREFGMSPSSRTQVAVAEKPKKQNPFLRLMED